MNVYHVKFRDNREAGNTIWKSKLPLSELPFPSYYVAESVEDVILSLRGKDVVEVKHMFPVEVLRTIEK